MVERSVGDWERHKWLRKKYGSSMERDCGYLGALLCLVTPFPLLTYLNFSLIDIFNDLHKTCTQNVATNSFVCQWLTEQLRRAGSGEGADADETARWRRGASKGSDRSSEGAAEVCGMQRTSAGDWSST